MPLFSKSPRSAAPPFPTLGVARRLSTSTSVADGASSMASVLAQTSPAPYRDMPELAESRIRWAGDATPPARGWTFTYQQKDLFVLAGWPDTAGSVFGLYLLGASPDQLTHPIVGMWKQSEPSLSSTGTLPGGQLGLWSPVADRDYLVRLVEAGGFSPTPDNVLRMAHQVTEMFLIKAAQFLGIGTPRAYAFMDRFQNVDPSTPQQVLDALCEIDATVVPYLQDLPGRIHGLLLEPGDDGLRTGHIWQQLH